MALVMADRSRPLLFKDKCHAGNQTGKFCELHKDHNGAHEYRGETWEGNYSYAGVVLVKALRKEGIIVKANKVTPQLSQRLGNVFDEATEKMDYSFCGDCEYQKDY